MAALSILPFWALFSLPSSKVYLCKLSCNFPQILSLVSGYLPQEEASRDGSLGESKYRLQALEQATWKWKITCWDKGFTQARVHCGERAEQKRCSSTCPAIRWWNWEVINGSSETTCGILCSSWPPREDAHTELAAIHRRAIRMIKRPEGVT